MSRSRAVVAAALCAAWLALPATGHAAECVKVVVDYGTVPGGQPPGGTNTRCVDVGDDGTAADALRGRARYQGNFLCAIDGYPETGCGNEPPAPYWSIWYWSGGRWVYSQEGVATLSVADRDRDGHPDPFGFRYHEVDKRQPPRADPSYPKPAPSRTTAPPRATTAPPAPGRTQPAPATGATTAAAQPTATAPAAGGVTTTPSARATGTPTATTTTAAPAPTPGGSTPADPSAEPAALPRDTGGGFPVGTVAGALLAAGLLVAAAVRARRPAA